MGGNQKVTKKTLTNGKDAIALLAPDANLCVEPGPKVHAGDTLARIPTEGASTSDITGGLPRVSELFEARQPKDAAEIAKIDGVVDFGPIVRGKRSLILTNDDSGEEEEHLVPIGKHCIVFKGDFVKKGQQLTEGPILPHDILDILGPEKLQAFLVNEVQEVYRLQGVTINDKHIECICRQMMKKVTITEPGDSDYLEGDIVELNQVRGINKNLSINFKNPAPSRESSIWAFYSPN